MWGLLLCTLLENWWRKSKSQITGKRTTV